MPTSLASSSMMGPSQQPSDQPSGSPQLDPTLVSAVVAMAKLTLFLSAVVDRVRSGVCAVFPQMEGVTAKDVAMQLRSITGSARMLALVLPLAKVASSESLTALYARTFERAAFGFAKMYLFALFMRVLLSWFPGIDWNAQPWTFLRLITEPYLQIYRGLLPPLFGSLDFTPLFGFLILQDVVEVMAPTYTMGLHDHDTSTRWTTSDVMCYFDGF